MMSAAATDGWRAPDLRMLVLALAIIGLLLAPDAARAQARPERAFRDAACHVAFRYPADWAVTIDTAPPVVACRFVLRPAAWDSLIVAADSIENAYTVRVIVEARGFDAVVPVTAFRRRDGAWIVGGRQGVEREATAIARNGWRGVWGEPLLGCSRIGGPYVAACELPTAVVGTDERSARIWGGVLSFDVFERVLETLELRP